MQGRKGALKVTVIRHCSYQQNSLAYYYH